MNCPTCADEDGVAVELASFRDVFRCSRCEGTFNELGFHARPVAETTLRTRRHRARKRIERALAVAELLRALPDVAAVAQVLAEVLQPGELAELQRRLKVEHQIADHKTSVARAQRTILELLGSVPDVGNGPAPGGEP